MRVLHVAKKLPPVPGGDATAVASLSVAQRRRGLEVDLLAYRATGIAEGEHTHVAGPLQSPEGLDRITLRRWRASKALGAWAKANLPRVRPDVVHAHAVDVGLPVARVARSLGIPAMLTCHGVWFATKGALSPSGALERSLMRRGRYRAITAVDADSVRALRAAGFEATLVPNGVDLGEFPSLAPRTGPFRFLFVGRLVPQKGVDVLLEAAARAHQSTDPPFAVEIVGDGPLRPALERRARDLGLEAVVRFRGSLDRPALLEAFQSSHAFVLPSRFEGFPIAILEAWAAGLPVVSTSVGGIPEVCTEDVAVLVPPDQPEGLAGAMTSLLRNPARQEALVRSSRALVEQRFAWDRIAGDYDRVYAAVAASRGGPA